MTSLVLWTLYAAVGAAAAGAARFLRRRIPPAVLVVLWIAPIAFLFPCFVRGRTPLPVDHAMRLPPWSGSRSAPPPSLHNPGLDDAVTQFAPWARAVRLAWKEGSLPLRDRWNGSGMALAVNGQSGAFSPFTFLMFPLPLARGFALAAAAKLFLALAGAWLWLRELGVSRSSALVGAAASGLGLGSTAFVLFPHASVLCLWPWTFFAIERVRDGAVRGRAFAALVAILFLWPLCGHPETAALGAVFALVWLLGRLAAGDLPDAWPLLTRLTAAALLAAGLAAFLLVPLARAIPASLRYAHAETYLSQARGWAPHPPLWMDGLVTSVLPRAFGDGIDSPPIRGSTAYAVAALAYPGILAWALVLGVLRPGSRRPRAELALLAPLLIGLAVALGSWPAFEIFLRVPVLRRMESLGGLRWANLALAGIAAFESDRLREDLAARGRSASRFFALGVAALAAVAVASFLGLRAAHAAAGGVGSQTEALAICLGALAAAAAAAFLASRIGSARAALPAAFFALAAAELLYQGIRLYRFGSPGDLFPETPAIAFLRSRPGPFRVVGEGPVLFPNSNVFAGLEDVRTHDPMERRDYLQLLDAGCGYDPAPYFKRVENLNCRELDLLNVRYLVSSPGRAAPGEKWALVSSTPDATVFENRSALPRVRALSPEVEVRIDDYRERTNAISFRALVAGASPRALLVSTVQDGGWSARDESGRRLETGRAEGPLLSVVVPPGDRVVRLEYRPPGFPAGAAISAATALFLAVLGASARRLRRARSRLSP